MSNATATAAPVKPAKAPSKAKPVSADFVRSHFRKRAKEGKSLIGPDEGALWKNIKGRGALHTDVVKKFHRDVRGKYVYTVGEGTKVKRVVLTGPKGRKFSVSTADLRALDGSSGKNGRISNETKAKMVEQILAREAKV